MLEFDNGEYESVCIFAEKTDDRDGWIVWKDPEERNSRFT